MKTKSTQPFMTGATLAKAGGDGNETKSAGRLKLGLDVDLRSMAVAIQCERDTIGPARKFSREQLIEWVKRQIASGTERNVSGA